MLTVDQNVTVLLSDEKESKLQRLKKVVNLDPAGKLNAVKQAKSSVTETEKTKNQPTKTLFLESVNHQNPAIKLEKNTFTELKNSLLSNNSTSVPVETNSVGKENEHSLSNTPSVTLPDGLPPSLILSVQKLIEAARKAGGEAGKCKFFNSDVNRILLQ